MTRIIITGWAETKTLPNGKQVTEVSGNQAPRRKNKDTGEWEQVGDALYIRAAFWEQDAVWVAQAAGQNRVTVEGELVARDYRTKDGNPGTALELRFPKLLGVIPPKQAATLTDTQPGTPQTGYGTPTTQAPAGGAVNDPWAAAPNNQFNEPAPF